MFYSLFHVAYNKIFSLLFNFLLTFVYLLLMFHSGDGLLKVKAEPSLQRNRTFVLFSFLKPELLSG